MYGRIIELTNEETDEDVWMRQYDIPEWFYGPIADFARESEDREGDIEMFVESLAGAAILEGNKLMFSEEGVMRYFSSRYDAFLTELAAVKTVTLEEFAGKSAGFGLRMHRLCSLYNDEYDTYIFHNERFMTLDDWLRDTDLTHPFFVGGVFDYHF